MDTKDKRDKDHTLRRGRYWCRLLVAIIVIAVGINDAGSHIQYDMKLENSHVKKISKSVLHIRSFRFWSLRGIADPKEKLRGLPFPYKLPSKTDKRVLVRLCFPPKCRARE